MLEQPKIHFDSNTMKVKICKECKGLGNVQNNYGIWMPCSNCHGQGRIVVKTNETEFSITQIDFAADGQLLIEAPREEDDEKLEEMKEEVLDAIDAMEDEEEEAEACPSCTN